MTVTIVAIDRYQGQSHALSYLFAFWCQPLFKKNLAVDISCKRLVRRVAVDFETHITGGMIGGGSYITVGFPT